MENQGKKLPVLFLILGEIVALYAGYLVNGVFKKGMNILVFLEKLNDALEHPFDNYLNKTTPKALIAASLIYVMIILIYITSRRNLMHGREYGTARFAKIKEVNKFLMDKQKNKNRILSKNTRMSIDTGVTQLNNNILVIGGSGAGKTFYIVKPNIMQMIPEGSFIATDPKGELLRATGGMLKNNGYTVKVINLIDMSKSDCYNPFDYLREENDVIKLVTNLINNTTPKETAPTDPFWEKSEALFLQALFYYVWLEMPPNRRNFQEVLNLLSDAEVNDKKDSELTKKMKELAIKSPLKNRHPAYKQYMKVVIGASDTVRSIIISANSRLALLENPQILRILSKDDLHLEELGIGVNKDEKSKTALFCVIPDSDKSYNFVIGMLYTQLFQKLYYQADFNYGGKLPLTVSLMLDEFANVALPDDFTSLLSTMRSRRINAVIIIQNLAQIKALFKDTWETITGNCDTLIYLGGNEKSTHQYISELMGKGTIDKRSNGETRGIHGSASRNYDVLGRELMTPDEVRNMNNRKCIIFIKGFDPIVDYKYVPFKHKNFKLTEDGGAKPYVHKPNITTKVRNQIRILSESELDTFEESGSDNKKVKVMDLSTNDIFNLPEEEKLNNKDEFTNRMCFMEFSDEQIAEINKAVAMDMDLSFLLNYMKPETSVKEMEKKRNEYKQTK